MTTAFVLSGGASLGAIHVGMVDALYAEGIRPDMVIGTSVGAVNGAWLAGGLAHLLEQHMTFTRLEDSTIPFSVIVTDVSTGEEVRLDRGPAIEAILASAAIPGVFPPVEINGRTFIDGGIVDNTPISQAIAAGATDVWVLSTGYSCALPAPPKSPLAMALHGLTMLIQQRFINETATRTYPVPVHLIPPPCPITVTPADFSQGAQLIDRARRGTAQWIANGEPYAIPLLGHHHAH